MKRLRQFRMTLRARIILSSLFLLVLLGGALWYLRTNVVRGGEAVRAQEKVLNRLENVNRLANNFGEFRYWLTDFALSQLNESEKLAQKSRQAMDQKLTSLLTAYPKRGVAIQKHLQDIWTAMQEGVKSYLDDNRVLGNMMVSNSRKSAQEASRLIQAIVSEQQTQAKQVGATVVANGERSVRLSLILLIISFIAALGLAWLTIQSITRPIAKMVSVAEVVAGGDLTKRVEVTTQDEIGQIGTWFNAFVDNIQNSIRPVAQNLAGLSTSSERMAAVSRQMAGNAQETSAQANSVSAASEEVSRNLQTVANAAEEMGASIKEVAQNAGEAARVATSAVSVADSTNEKVARLGESSAEIGKVIEVINSIAEQTNLLALNATIEAARAGEAGKGFAVVANEVKELAKQTARATEDISKKVEAIQSDTAGAVEAIGQIGGVINQVNDISSTIAGAVEEQSATTQEIGRNVAEAAKGSTEIAENIARVAGAANSTSDGATEIQGVTNELSRIGAGLQQLIAQFNFGDDQASAPRKAVEKKYEIAAGPQPSLKAEHVVVAPDYRLPAMVASELASNGDS